jgi:Zn-dependent metalloprotease
MKKTAILVLAVGFIGNCSHAQTVIKEATGKAGMSPEVVEFSPATQPAFIKGNVLVKDHGNFRQSNETILKTSEKDMLGEEQFRYQQKINGIPVDGTTYVVHVAGGKVKGQNGVWVADAPADLASTPALTEKAALQAAMKAFGAKVYKWQLSGEEAFIKRESGNPDATFLPKGELVYYSGEDQVTASKMRLAYKLDLYAHEPVGRRIYFVDAQTGSILGYREVMHTINAAGSALTGFSGTQNITTDSYNGTYRLRETGRGNGIQTFNLNKGVDYSLATDFSDADNYWNNVNTNFDQYATDAHWGAEMTYDYYKNTFGRNSINNAGFTINSYVHYSTAYFNAFWDGSRMTYGDGNSMYGNKPLTAMDVCGHEITHGLTSYTAGLNYSNESGALNEGFSDIFGTTIEFYAKGAAGNWLIGEGFYTLRSMSNPKMYGQPSTYKGVNWATGTADYGGVHTNSGVINYWYYLIANGGSGINDNSVSYSVSGLGLAKAAAIAYRTLTVYLVPTSQYVDARTYSIQAATDLYGATSNEVAQVTAAWVAVGVGAAPTTPPPPPVCADGYEANESKGSARGISANADISAQVGNNIDKDWFVVSTSTAAPNLKITLTNLAADYDVRLYNSHGKQIGISQTRGTSPESITYNSNSANSYYIQVSGYNGAYNTSNCYTLRAATSNVNQLYDLGVDTSDESIAGRMAAAGEYDDAVTVFPNPAQKQVNVSFTATEAGNQTVSVSDLMGRVIMTKSFKVEEGQNSVTLPLEQLRSGLYFVQVAGKTATKLQVVD